MFTMFGGFGIGIRFSFVFVGGISMFGIRCWTNGRATKDKKKSFEERLKRGGSYPSLERVFLFDDEWRVSWEDEWDFFFEEDFVLESELCFRSEPLNRRSIQIKITQPPYHINESILPECSLETVFGVSTTIRVDCAGLDPTIPLCSLETVIVLFTDGEDISTTRVNV